jgi:hypothetical protein
MDLNTATEQAYKNGYEQGQKDAAKDIITGILKNTTPTFDKDGKPIIRLNAAFALDMCKKYGVKMGDGE